MTELEGFITNWISEIEQEIVETTLENDFLRKNTRGRIWAGEPSKVSSPEYPFITIVVTPITSDWQVHDAEVRVHVWGTTTREAIWTLYTEMKSMFHRERILSPTLRTVFDTTDDNPILNVDVETGADFLTAQWRIRIIEDQQKRTA